MKPFTFTSDTAKADLARFDEIAKTWKPSLFNADCELRLDYYLDRQLEDTKAELRRRFPQTHQEMVPVTLPLTRYFVNEQARVFLNDTKLELVAADGDELGADDELAKWWSTTKKDMGLSFRLKNVDRYTTLHRTCFLRIARVGSKLAAQIFFAQRVDAVFDPAYPLDLDMAYAVRLEIGSEPGSTVLGPDGAQAMPDVKRYEIWCARPDGAFCAIVKSSGEVEAREDNRLGMVPVVMFTAHSEELGPFVLAGQGLHLFNRAVNIAATDEQHIAEAQGFGQLFVTGSLGAKMPGTVVQGPNKAIVLPDGCDAKVLNGNAPIGDLLARLDAAIKRAAVLHGIPPGSVSLEARAVASGVSLQIEMRPLLEARQDAIEVYQAPVSRLWTVTRAVHNATLQKDEKQVPDGVAMRWYPGEVQMPSDQTVELDNVIVQIANNFMTRAEGIAKLRGIPLAEAKTLAEKIAAENDATKAWLTSRSRGALASSAAASMKQAKEEGDGTAPPPAGEAVPPSITGAARERLMAPGAQRQMMQQESAAEE